MINNYWTDLSGKLYNSLEDFPEGTFGFVYKVKNKSNGKIYIGKKVLYFNRKKKLTKKELAEITSPGRKPTSKSSTIGKRLDGILGFFKRTYS
jgi:serine/threonine protein kinase